MSEARGGTVVIDDLRDRLRKFRDDRGWSQFHNPKDLAISVSVEAGELLEVFQWRASDVPIDADTRAEVADEAADVLIYLVMLCDHVGVDLFHAAFDKVRLNEERFPIDRAFGVAKPGKRERG